MRTHIYSSIDSSSTHQKTTMAAEAEEEMEDDMAVAGPLPLARLEV